MGRVNETVRTVNSAFRTALFALALAGATFVGWKGYSLYNEPQKKLAEQQQRLDKVVNDLTAVRDELAEKTEQVATLAADVEKKAAEITKLQTTKRLLKLQHRIARIRVIDQQPAEQDNGDEENVDESATQKTTIEFVEVNSEGAPIDDQPRTFEIDGDRVYVECLVAKFDDAYVERADLDRGTAICLIQRVFGEEQEPREGYEIDPQGTSPTSYARGGKMSDFERQIWDDFWTIANDRAKAKKLGIRAAHASAPSIEVKRGAVYELELRATGEFTLQRVQDNGDANDL